MPSSNIYTFLKEFLIRRACIATQRVKKCFSVVRCCGTVESARATHMCKVRDLPSSAFNHSVLTFFLSCLLFAGIKNVFFVSRINVLA